MELPTMLKKTCLSILAAGLGLAMLPLSAGDSAAQSRHDRVSNYDYEVNDDGTFERRRYRTGRYRHYRDGYYYRTPWWIEAPVAVATFPLRVLGAPFEDERYLGYDDRDFGTAKDYVNSKMRKDDRIMPAQPYVDNPYIAP
jgi:hypothetical protein